eukprot:Gregarina_sp_Poly_1__11362@NODE_959_length_5551_cov_11_991247_g679_i0_p1_GENE_NODE_959_length_5551_cov_11_991247_g679_i0NODE_959_length_5551_cov_11_991247_g679_i0_p1_ORF_typecomplete_len157_score2_03Sugar_transport/PF06800_12/0_041GerPB/PF10803_8/4_2e02GerPB/PF10803_8/2_7GerPB/PF10803_8/2e02_NODE_959_length_5551_cov_11_991247_g679_i050625532
MTRNVNNIRNSPVLVIPISNSCVLLIGSIGGVVLLREHPESTTMYMISLLLVVASTTALFGLEIGSGIKESISKASVSRSARAIHIRGGHSPQATSVSNTGCFSIVPGHQICFVASEVSDSILHSPQTFEPYCSMSNNATHPSTMPPRTTTPLDFK